MARDRAYANGKHLRSSPSAPLGAVRAARLRRVTSDLQRDPFGFSLTSGGPWYRAMIRYHLTNPVVRVWWLTVIAWSPLALAAAVRALAGQPIDRAVFDLSVHVRLLVAIPMMLLGELLIDAQCRGALGVLYTGELVDREALQRAATRAEELRDSPIAEGVLLLIALAGGQLVMFGAFGVFHGGGTPSAWTFARLWYGCIASPAFQFVTFRWLWHWMIWTYVLVRIARLPLQAIATHPDGACGIGSLAWPITGFASFIFAMGSVLSAAWETQILADRMSVRSLLPAILAFLVIAVSLGCGPVLLFTSHLYRMRRRTLASYTQLATSYVKQFDAKWIGGGTDELLGTSDLQSLADLGNSFGVIVRTRMTLFTPRNVIDLVLAALVPLIPLALSFVTVEEILKRIVGALLGGPI